jgi:hypothetical protein
VIAGAVIRVELVPGPRVFDLMVAALLLPLGVWLAAARPVRDRDPARPARQSRPPSWSCWRAWSAASAASTGSAAARSWRRS